MPKIMLAQSAKAYALPQSSSLPGLTQPFNRTLKESAKHVTDGKYAFLLLFTLYNQKTNNQKTKQKQLTDTIPMFASYESFYFCEKNKQTKQY